MKKRRMSFLRFVTEVLGLRFSLAWIVVIKVAFDAVPIASLTPAEQELARAIFNLLGADLDALPPEALRVVVLRIGRGAGKTTLAAGWVLYSIFASDLSGIGPGDEPVAIAISVDKKTARLVVKIARALLTGADKLRKFFLADTPDGFKVRRSDKIVVAFESFAASRGGANTRGRTIVGFVLDEAEFLMSDGAYAITDRDAFSAMIPRLVLDGKGVLLSTAWPVPTLMSELFEANHGTPMTAIAGLAPTLMMRPNDAALRAAIEIEKKRNPVEAAREYDCDVTAMAGAHALLDPVSIRQAIDPERPLVKLAPLLPRAAGADLALVNDPSALAIVARDGEQYELLEVYEKRPTKGTPLKLSVVVNEFADVLDRHGLQELYTDVHLRQTAREFSEPRNIDILDAPAGSEGNWEMFGLLSTLFREGRFRMPKHPRLEAMLRAVIAKALPGGGYRISQPRKFGAHGDIVSALAAATFAASRAELHRRGDPPLISTVSGCGTRYVGLGRPDDSDDDGNGRGFGDFC